MEAGSFTAAPLPAADGAALTMRHSRWAKRQAPSTPASVHSRSRSGGLSDSMYQRAVSAPYVAMMAVGSMTFFFDLLIFSERPTSTAEPSIVETSLASLPFLTSSGNSQFPAASR